MEMLTPPKHIKMDLVYTNAHFTPPGKSFILYPGSGKHVVTIDIIRYVYSI